LNYIVKERLVTKRIMLR